MFKHNKKQNTAILYECLIKELAAATIQTDKEKIGKILGILKEFFSAGMILKEELGLYHNLSNVPSIKPDVAEKLINEMSTIYDGLDKEKILYEQKRLVSKMGDVRKEIFSHFVSNYKTLASIYQIFRKTIKPHERIILEGVLKNSLSIPKLIKSEEKPLSNLVYKRYIERFNSEYDGLLLEQKELLKNYILGGTEFAVYLNEEIGRLKEELKKDVKDDRVFLVIEMLESFKNEIPTREMVEKVLKIQELLYESNN